MTTQRQRRAIKPPVCPYCGNFSESVDGRRVYPHRRDLWQKRFFLCNPCGAWVGTHQHSGQPLGRLANAELRAAKKSAHAAFDPLWKEMARSSGKKKGRARSEAYRWLADELEIDASDCQIGQFDVETCQRVIEACARWPAGTQISVRVRDGVPPRYHGDI